MAAATTYLPGPPEVLPGRPDAVIDLQTPGGAASAGVQWRYHDASVRTVDFVGVGQDLGPSGPPNHTYDIEPHAEGVDVDDSGWQLLAPEDTSRRLSTGRVCFAWYRTTVTVPDRVGDLDPTGATVVFEVVVDDYAEIWVDGRLPITLGASGGQVVAGFNAPNRVVLTRDARPGQRFQIAVFGINGPISASPTNYIWFRTATLDFYRPEHAPGGTETAYDVDRVDARLDEILTPGTALERVASGFAFTEGPVWTSDGALLFSVPDTNTVYRWAEPGSVTVFRAKSGYTGPDIGRYRQPGSNGLTFDPEGRLTLCQHGNRRVLRDERRGNTTVLADRYDGRRLNSPNDLVYAADGTLFFTDPPFGLPGGADDPARELGFSGVFRVRDGSVALVTGELAGPNGIALSPDERFLYVGNWDLDHKVVMRYRLDAGLEVVGSDVLVDLTGADGEDAIDGIKVDRSGHLYVCGPGGVWVLTPDGQHLGTLRLPEAPHNLAWGDHDARTLYLTAQTSIYRIRLNVPGVRP